MKHKEATKRVRSPIDIKSIIKQRILHPAIKPSSAAPTSQLPPIITSITPANSATISQLPATITAMKPFSVAATPKLPATITAMKPSAATTVKRPATITAIKHSKDVMTDQYATTPGTNYHEHATADTNTKFKECAPTAHAITADICFMCKKTKGKSHRVWQWVNCTH